jgi:hypothetical protein
MNKVPKGTVHVRTPVEVETLQLLGYIRLGVGSDEFGFFVVMREV